MANVKHVNYYTNVITNWSKELGAKPTEAQLSVAHVFGRPGKQSLAVALALRDGGVTGQQIKLASALFDGKATPQLNHMRDLIAAKMFDRDMSVQGYALTLASNGKRFIDQYGAKVEAKPAPKAAKAPAKAKGERKRKAKATAAPVETPASEAPQVTEQPSA